MRRGEVWVANLFPKAGAEPGKTRPVLIIQSDYLTDAGSETVIILPLTTQVRPSMTKLRLVLPVRDRLLKPSQVMFDKPRAIDRGRLSEGPLTRLNASEMASVERGLANVLGLLG